MVVEQAAFAGGFCFDPSPAGEVDGADSFVWHPVDEVIGIEAEVGRVRVQVVEIEKQRAIRPGRITRSTPLPHLAPRRIDQGRYVFDEGRRADDLFGIGQFCGVPSTFA